MLEFHECAAIFPLMTESGLLELAADIQANGLIEPIVLCNGEILDGRNRYLACMLAEVEPHYEPWRGYDALAYVISKNLKRRHLNESQRAVVANRLARMGRGRPSEVAVDCPDCHHEQPEWSPADEPPDNDHDYWQCRRCGYVRSGDKSLDLAIYSQPQAATMLNVSPALVRQVKAIEREAPELIEQIERGELTAHRAYMDVHYSSDRLDWGTPQAFFNQLDEEFGFTLDVCATEKTAKCKRYFSPEDDGLSRRWQGVCWMNPPYGNEIGTWLAKAYQESRNGAIVVCLVPSRTDTAWWHDYVMKAEELRFVRGRLRFEGAQTPAPFPSAVVILRTGFEGMPTISGLNWSNE